MSDRHADAELQQLLDHHAIQQVLNRYARALDEKRYELLDSCFTPDAELDFGDAGGGVLVYPAAKRWLSEVLEPLAEMQHCITNLEATVDGDAATARSYTLNINGLRADGALRHIIVGAIYFDELARTPQGWRIRRRRQTRLCAVDTATLPGQS